MYYVYLLRCPRTNDVRYVGRTQNPKNRYNSHLGFGAGANNDKHEWICELKGSGLKPIFDIVYENTDKYLVIAEEKRLILHYCIIYTLFNKDYLMEPIKKSEEMVNKNHVSVADYAKLCGNITPSAVYMRIKTGKIKPELITFNGNQVQVIDVSIYPPGPIVRGRKPFKASQ